MIQVLYKCLDCGVTELGYRTRKRCLECSTANTKAKRGVLIKQYQQSPEGKERFAAYLRTKEGRVAVARRNAKRRDLGNLLLFPNPFPNWVKVDYHHVANYGIVALPRSIHRANYTGLGKTKEHRELLLPYIRQIYQERNLTK